VQRGTRQALAGGVLARCRPRPADRRGRRRRAVGADPGRCRDRGAALKATGPLDAHPVFDPGILRGFHLLESDAGTGKPWTIAGLVVRALVELELEIDRILVVTFTNAATAELAARI